MAENNKPGIKWFSRLLPNLEKNKGLTIWQKRANAEKDCRIILADQSAGEYRIVRNGFEWKGPTKGEPRHRLTVWIELKRKPKPGEPGPSDPPIPAKRNPPPSM